MDDDHLARQLASPPLGWMPFDTPAPSGRNPRRRSAAQRETELSRQRRTPRRSPLTAERWRLLVRGTVQGVGYRQACRRRANELGLAGWVRNRDDGSVEVQAEGPEQSLTELRVWCEQGPAEARVASVLTSRIATTGADWFEIRPTVQATDRGDA